MPMRVGRLVDKCQRIADDIRLDLASALMWYHELGKTILDVHGEQIKMLSKELGKGFSVSTLYYCRQFVQKYPHFETFAIEYGDCAWRQALKRIVNQPRADSNALESQTGGQQPAMKNLTPVRNWIKLDPTNAQRYDYAREHGFQEGLSAFVNKCISGYYKLKGRSYMLYDDGRVDYLDST
ncbi:MAG: hypothetical protein ABSF09_00670 [Candidatus Bathyarchaeia archaeon]